ncbi:ATP-grasp domain-containing protein [Rhizobium leguminosarum]|uniref:Carboxylate--amine ligase n=1 Tax=Rhizobium leguminosarum TaxID=384 RepID=A0A6P0DGK5_RHILE|nr:ATP-grasp domain-containing protein [Rhizobium leguminosarum]NEK52204.1 carboxylate--amine ligase [Rhizobium leguminosarum]WFT86861.1 ATP-grasp domain-containing protein [Rhizobium leguminosarum]
MTADEYFVEPSSSSVPDFDYAEWALNTAAAKRVGGMLAMRNRKKLIAVRDQFSVRGVRLAAGAMDSETIDLCDHKDRFTVAMKAAGIPVAETIAANTLDELRSAIADIASTDTEVCVKPAVGVYGRGFWHFVPGLNPFSLFSTIDANEVDPEVYIESYARAENPSTLIVMQYLPGIESSIDCVCDNGRLVAHAVRQKASDRQTVFTGGREVEVARAVVAELKLDGLVNVQTKADAADNPVLLEVNTRPSGGVGYSAAAGVNLPLACARMLLGERIGDTSLSSPVVIRRSDATYALPRATAALNGWAA